MGTSRSRQPVALVAQARNLIESASFMTVNSLWN
jgi:hypothetical protein